MNDDVVIDVQHLRKTYDGTVAVADVSFSVRRGEIFGILGPNGAGKTTTVEAMVGLRPIDSGRVRVLGLDPQRDTQRIRDLVGVQLQQARLPARLRVAEALALYASFYPHPADPGELLEVLGLTEHRRTAFGALSGGQQQRLSIALALVGNPQIAVLDELTTGLDPQARRATWDLINQVRARGVTIVLVTHYMDEAENLCDRLAIINHGTVVTTGRPSELTAAAAQTRYTLRLPDALDTQAVVVAVQSQPGVNVTPDGHIEIVDGGPGVLTFVLATLASQGITPSDIRTHSRSLEDVFLTSAKARLALPTTSASHLPR